MDGTDRTARIAKYAEGPEVVRAALAGISETELDHRPAPGEWTPREIVQHLADSETHSYIRLRKLLAEDDPVIVAYDQDTWAHRLHYADRPIASSLAVLDAVRAASTDLLGGLDDADFARAGTHTESGPYSVETWLTIYADHAHDHADQVRAARSTPAGRA
jgi:hypothetical protein